MICNPLILINYDFAFVFLRDLRALCGKMSLLLVPIFPLSSAVRRLCFSRGKMAFLLEPITVFSSRRPALASQLKAI